MKYLFILVICVTSIVCYGQVDNLQSNYNGGQEGLAAHFRGAYPDNCYQDNNDLDNRYFEITFKVDKHGRVEDQILVCAMTDSVYDFTGFINAVKSTSGEWINLNGEEFRVILPIVLQRIKELRPPPLKNIKLNVYSDSEKFNVIWLEPLIIQIGYINH